MKMKPNIIKDKSSKKDWRDAFVEAKIITEDMKVIYSASDCVKIKEASICTEYQLLAKYCTEFRSGGFWYDKRGLHFVTSGVGSDEEATYEYAVNFIRKWSE